MLQNRDSKKKRRLLQQESEGFTKKNDIETKKKGVPPGGVPERRGSGHRLNESGNLQTLSSNVFKKRSEG